MTPDEITGKLDDFFRFVAIATHAKGTTPESLREILRTSRQCVEMARQRMALIELEDQENAQHPNQ